MRLAKLVLVLLLSTLSMAQDSVDVPWGRGEILLDEGFETPLQLFDSPETAGPGGWVANTQMGRAWEQVFQPDYARDGLGGMVLLPGEDDCGEALLRTPLLSLPDKDNFLVIGVHSMRGPNDPPVEIHVFDESGKRIRRDNPGLSLPTGDGWDINVVRPCDLPDTFRVGLFVPPGCNSQTFDNLRVGAFERRETRIVQPERGRTTLVVGESITFKAETDGDDTVIKWGAKSRDAAGQERLLGEGAEITTSFDTPGFYTVAAVALDSGCQDRTPEFRDIVVKEVNAEIWRPERNNRQPLIYALNETLSAVGNVEDPFSRVGQVRWLLNGETICSADGLPETPTCDVVLSNRGKQSLVLQALDREGQVIAEESRILYVDPGLAASLVEPPADAHLEVGKEHRFAAAIVGSEADSEGTESFWVINGEKVGEGPEVLYTPSKHGKMMATFVVRNTDKDMSEQLKLPFFSFDPNRVPKPQIISPHTDWQVPAGSELFFDSSFRDAPVTEQFVYWEIENTDTETLLASSDHATLGKVKFEEEGCYEATLFFRGRGGNEPVSTRRIMVGDISVEDNDDNSRAKAIGNGKYQGLSHDRPHFYEVNVPSDNQPIRVSVTLEEPSKVVFFHEGTRANPTEVCVSGTKTLQLRGLPAGDYIWGVVPDESCGSGSGKKNLSFSFNLSVLNPALYFTDIAENGNETTELGIVNTTGELAEIEIIGYDATGAIICKASREIAALGSLRDTAANIFGDNAEQVVWARVDSGVSLVGFSRTRSHDEMEAHATSAPSLLYDELYVPHIAKDTVSWYTKAAVVNGQDKAISSMMTTTESSQELFNSSSYSKDAFDFTERLGAITEANYWATFADDGGSASLAGTEVFGTNGNVQQVVGLTLGGSPADNPNFTNGSDRLYFSHITEGSDFWTGIALVNRGTQDQGAVINVYGDGGVLTGTGTLVMTALEKKVMTADVLLQEAGIEATDVDWMEVLADTNITGYELFGTNSGGDRLAGLEAINEVNTSICMPFVDPSGDSWHGISVVNVENEAATVSFTLYNEAGAMVACVENQVLAAKEKQIYVLAQLFESIPDEASWLKIEGDRNLVGFQLIGNVANEHMAALIAQ